MEPAALVKRNVSDFGELFVGFIGESPENLARWDTHAAAAAAATVLHLLLLRRHLPPTTTPFGFATLIDGL